MCETGIPMSILLQCSASIVAELTLFDCWQLCTGCVKDNRKDNPDVKYFPQCFRVRLSSVLIRLTRACSPDSATSCQPKLVSKSVTENPQ